MVSHYKLLCAIIHDYVTIMPIMAIIDISFSSILSTILEKIEGGTGTDWIVELWRSIDRLEKRFKKLNGLVPTCPAAWEAVTSPAPLAWASNHLTRIRIQNAVGAPLRTSVCVIFIFWFASVPVTFWYGHVIYHAYIMHMLGIWHVQAPMWQVYQWKQPI